MSNKTLILVIGCHRSGTSAVTGALFRMGVKVNDWLIGPGVDNERGFFEDRRVVNLHDQLLGYGGSKWDRPVVLDEFLLESMASAVVVQLRTILREMPGPICTIKDPRATLFVPLWQKICDAEGVDLRVLYVQRRRKEIISSLCAREGWDEKRAALVVDRYCEDAIAACKRHRSSRIVFPDEVTSEQAWRRIFADLEIDIAPDMDAVETIFDPFLIHYGESALQTPTYALIVPSASDENLLGLVDSFLVNNEGTHLSDIVVVSDGLSEDTRKKLNGVTWVQGVKPFVFSRALNQGADAAGDRDIVFCGDDVRFTTPNTLRHLALMSRGASAVSPKVRGVCGQAAQRVGSAATVAQWLAFICVYISRESWNRVGPMDERYTGYGMDDVDWCHRAIRFAPLLVDPDTVIDHIEKSVYRADDSWKQRNEYNRQLFKDKWITNKDTEGTMSKKSTWRRKKKDKKPKSIREGRRVSVLVPAGDMCHTEFAISLVHMIQNTILNAPDNLEALTINAYGTSMLPFSRQILAKTALEQGVTHMLWIDSDMQFTNDMLLRFLKHDKPIIGINAMSRRSPFNNTAQAAPNEQLMTSPDSTGLEKVHRCGFGVLWVASEVFAKMELPWFSFDWMPELCVFRGEDYGFLEKAKELGYEVWVDHDISKTVNHLGCFGYNPQMKAIVGEMRYAPRDAHQEESAA